MDGENQDGGLSLTQGPLEDKLYLGDAIDFFLRTKRSGGRSERTVDEYRKKLDLFQRWAARNTASAGSAASTAGEEDQQEGLEAVDAPYLYIGANEVEAYIVHLKERGLSDTSRKGHLAVLKSFFATVSRRRKLADRVEEFEEMRFHQKAPKRSYLTKREAEMLLSPIAAAAPEDTEEEEAPDPDEDSEDIEDARVTSRKRMARVFAARDHAAFSAMIYAGLRIEECTSLTVEALSFARGAEEVRVAKGKGNKERIVPMSPKLKKSLRLYLKVRLSYWPPERSAVHTAS